MNDRTALFAGLCQHPFVLLDGGTGTGLMAAGMPKGVCVERWVLEHPQVLIDWQRRYLAAGSRILLTPTFGANRARLKQFGEQDNVTELNRRLAALTVEAAAGKALVAGDVSPTGLFCEPFGDTSFEELVAIYTEQIAALKQAGADLIFAETMMSLGDVRAAVVAARDCGLPVLASVTLENGGRTVSGMPADAAVLALQAAGADAVGLNCSTGAQDMASLLPALQKYARIPLLVKPNAGTPDAPLSPAAFGEACAAMAQQGVFLLGGCCQSTPEHIAALNAALPQTGCAAGPLRTLLAKLCRIPEAEAAGKPEPAGLPLCFENRVFAETAGGEAGLVLSEAIPCNEDLEDALPDAADGEAACALVQLHSTDDARRLACACFMSPLPVAVAADDDAVLENALRIFPGRCAAVCRTPAQRAIAARWGAMVLER
ncbi:MAG: homocysteine S-methyltransferase family protein [Oscillospiraceae bacterium]|nr:homocysteine S-methyltransferase family protein [Oscillospiraceae bacterium]